MRPVLALLLAPLALSGCVTYHMRSDGMVRAGFGQTADLGDLHVTPLGLLEDSRCAAGVQCVWAGRVRIEAQLVTPNSTETRELTLGVPVPVARGRLALDEVLPGKRADAPLYPEQYRFGFRITP